VQGHPAITIDSKKAPGARDRATGRKPPGLAGGRSRARSSLLCPLAEMWRKISPRNGAHVFTVIPAQAGVT